jgi:hypothetical protein
MLRADFCVPIRLVTTPLKELAGALMERGLCSGAHLIANAS